MPSEATMEAVDELYQEGYAAPTPLFIVIRGEAL